MYLLGSRRGPKPKMTSHALRPFRKHCAQCVSTNARSDRARVNPPIDAANQKPSES